MPNNAPLFMQAAELKSRLGDEDLLIIDLSIPQVHQEGHIPGAIHLPYPKIVYAHDNVDCDVPPDDMLSAALSAIGLQDHHYVIAYDSQHNPMASRLCWTLEDIGHKRFSMLNGGWHSWKCTGLPIETEINKRPASDYTAKQSGVCNATVDYIKRKLGDPDTVIIDTRMYEEFTNELQMTDRGGKIPGAVHLDWMSNINENDNYQLLSDDVLMQGFKALDISPENEIIVYCQTHLRSAHTYQVLKHLGFTKVRGYAAGYSEWGNETDTSIEDEVLEAE